MIHNLKKDSEMIIVCIYEIGQFSLRKARVSLAVYTTKRNYYHAVHHAIIKAKQLSSMTLTLRRQRYIGAMSESHVGEASKERYR